MTQSKIYTYSTFRDNVLMLLERYTSNGRLNTVGEVRDLEERLYTSAEAHLRKLYCEYGLCKKRAVLSFDAPRLLYDFGSFTIEPYGTETRKIDGVGLYYRIRACGSGSVGFHRCSSTPNLYISTETGQVTEYCGAISEPQVGSYIAINADAGLRIVSFEIFLNESGAEILYENGRCGARLPEDLSRILGVYDSMGERVSEKALDISYDDGTVFVSERDMGVYTIEYLAEPEKITRGYECRIKLPSVLFDALCYMCAADICPSFDGETYSKLTYKYREILENYYDRGERSAKSRNGFYGIVGRIRKSLGR